LKKEDSEPVLNVAAKKAEEIDNTDDSEVESSGKNDPVNEAAINASPETAATITKMAKKFEEEAEEKDLTAIESLSLIVGVILIILAMGEFALLCNAKGISYKKWCNVVDGPTTPWEEEVKRAQFHAQLATAAAVIATKSNSENQESTDGQQDALQEQDESDRVEEKDDDEKEMQNVTFGDRGVVPEDDPLEVQRLIF